METNVAGVEVRKADNGYVLHFHSESKDTTSGSLDYNHATEVYTNLNRLMKRVRELLS